MEPMHMELAGISVTGELKRERDIRGIYEDLAHANPYKPVGSEITDKLSAQVEIEWNASKRPPPLFNALNAGEIPYRCRQGERTISGMAIVEDFTVTERVEEVTKDKDGRPRARIFHRLTIFLQLAREFTVTEDTSKVPSGFFG